MTILPLWVILSVVSGLGSSFFSYTSRFLLKDNDDPALFGWYVESLRFVAFIFVAIFDWKIIISFQSFVIFLLVGVTEAIGIYWYMKTHEFTHLSISTIISRTRLIWVAVFAFLFVHEHLLLSEYIGIAILFVGLTLVVSPHKMFIDKGVMYANATAIMFGLNIVLVKMVLPFGSNSVVNASLGFPSLFLFPLFMKDFRKRFKKTLRKKFVLKTFSIAINIVQLFLFTAALRLGDASKVTAIYQGMFVFSVLAGVIFLKEREDVVKKIIGTVITLGGVLLISYS